MRRDTIAATIRWNTGETSSFTADRSVTDTGLVDVVTYTGTVTAGLFAGKPLVQTLVYPLVQFTLCAIPPGIVERSSLVNVTSIGIV